jgi:hypothetical protein
VPVLWPVPVVSERLICQSRVQPADSEPLSLVTTWSAPAMSTVPFDSAAKVSPVKLTRLPEGATPDVVAAAAVPTPARTISRVTQAASGSGGARRFLGLVGWYSSHVSLGRFIGYC